MGLRGGDQVGVPVGRVADGDVGIGRRTGNVQAVPYEVVCETTKEIERSRTRRRSDAYERTRHRRL